MLHHRRFPNVVFGAHLRPESAVLAIMVLLLFLLFVFLFMTLTAPPAQAQTFKVIYNFTGGADGALPYADLTMDRAGNLYGTTTQRGASGTCTGNGCGTVFRLSKKESGWILMPLYAFTGGKDGAYPQAGVVIGPDGSLYGTTRLAGAGSCVYQLYPPGCGTVFNLKPPAHAPPTVFGGWTETVIHSFNGDDDGAFPLSGVVFDQAGRLYGTTSGFGAFGDGTVYELTPSQGYWTESTLHAFTGGSDGAGPAAGVILDTSGDLYGTTEGGGTYYGTAFQLTQSGSGWTENVLYTFDYYGSSGGMPVGGLIFDPSGNLYGTTSRGHQSATVFMLSPSGPAWTFTVLHDIPGSAASLVMDAAGNLYGTTEDGGAFGNGSVFKLTPGAGGWTCTTLHDFTGGSDGGTLQSNVIFDASGNLYGTTVDGGAYGYGVVFEITP